MLKYLQGKGKQFRKTTEPQVLLWAVKKIKHAKCSVPPAQPRQKPHGGTFPLTMTLIRGVAGCPFPFRRSCCQEQTFASFTPADLSFCLWHYQWLSLHTPRSLHAFPSTIKFCRLENQQRDSMSPLAHQAPAKSWPHTLLPAQGLTSAANTQPGWCQEALGCLLRLILDKFTIEGQIFTAGLNTPQQWVPEHITIIPFLRLLWRSRLHIFFWGNHPSKQSDFYQKTKWRGWVEIAPSSALLAACCLRHRGLPHKVIQLYRWGKLLAGLWLPKTGLLGIQLFVLYCSYYYYVK